MKEFQIRTYNNENLAEAIQYKLFNLGYSWAYPNSTAIQYLHAASFQVYSNRVITWNRNSYYPSGGEIITLEELFTMQPEAKETIKIGTQTYDKADFEAATKHLTPVK